jgi:hypothetical protein
MIDEVSAMEEIERRRMYGKQQEHPLCAECEKAQYKKKEWYLCRENCVQHLITDACMNPEWFVPSKVPEPSPKTEPTYQELVDFARWTQTFWKHGIEIMRKNNLVIKTDEPMEKLAFTFYMDLCEIDTVAAHLFGEGYGDKNHKDEPAIVSQKMTPYPKPYEERIKADAIKQALAPLKAVYEKFNHLDKCLSDTEWCKAGETSAIYGIAGEMWRAIKEAMVEKR